MGEIHKRYRRLGPFVLVSLLLAQVAIDLHKVTHSDALQEARCSLCISANHVGGPPPLGSSFALPVARSVPAETIPSGFNPTSAIAPYQSRAPPQNS